MGPAGRLGVEAARLPVLSGPGSATGTVQACQGEPSTGQRVGTAPFLSSAGHMSLANPSSGLTRGPTPLQDQQDQDGEGVVAIQVRHWGSRGQPHPLSQLCQPPNETGMCMGEGELAPQLGTLKVEPPPHQHTPCVVLVSEAQSPCPLLRAAWRPSQPPSCPGRRQGTYDRPEWTLALLCWVLWERHQAGCPGSLLGRVRGHSSSCSSGLGSSLL